MNRRWYIDFFQGLSVEMWIKAANEFLDANAEARFLEQELQIVPPDRVLDIPCGQGRHARALAARGYRVTGVDISTEFLAHARQEAETAGLECRWVQGEMQAIDWEEEFDAAFCLGNSFGYLDRDDLEEFLKRLARAVRTGGRVVFDNPMVAETILPTLSKSDDYEFGGIRVHSEHRYHAAQSVLETEYAFESGDRREVRTNWTFCQTTAEMRRLVEAAGFRTVALYGDIERRPFELGCRSLYLVAEKG